MYIYALSLNKKKITETKHGTGFLFSPTQTTCFLCLLRGTWLFFLLTYVTFKREYFLIIEYCKHQD